MKKSVLVIFFIACSLGGNVYGQLNDNQWSFQPRFGSQSFLLGGLGLPADYNDFWWFPATYLCINAPISMETPNGKVDFDYGNFWEKYYLWGFRNYSIGFEVTWQKRTLPIGLFFDCDYKHYVLDMKFPGEDSHNKYTTQSVVPALGFRCIFGSFDKKANPLIELGAGYNYNFSFKGKYGNETEAINNGIIGIYGVGFDFPATRTILTLRYQMNHYNYFNESYTPDSGATYPYKGVKSTIGCFNFSWSHRF